VPSSAAATASRSGASSALRMSLPTYCIWRRRPSCDLVRAVLVDGVAQRLGHLDVRPAGLLAARPAATPSLQVVRLLLELRLAGAAVVGFFSPRSP
jgi:hypothetical protein